MPAETVKPTILAAARAALLAAGPNEEVVVLDAPASASVTGSMQAARVGSASLGVFADQALDFILRKRAAGGEYRDAPDDDGASPTPIAADAWRSVRTTWDAVDHRLILKTGATPPTVVELSCLLAPHGEKASEDAAPTFSTKAIDLTAEQPPAVLVPQRAGKSWKSSRLEIEILNGSIEGVTAADLVTLGANGPNFDNLATFALTGHAPGTRLRYGGGVFSAIDVGSSDLVVHVASPQAGGVLVARFHVWGFYV